MPGHWRTRRDALGLGEQIHLQSLPFKGRPSLCQWQQLMGLIAERIGGSFGYGLVVFDTLPSLWPLRDENDANY